MSKRNPSVRDLVELEPVTDPPIQRPERGPGTTDAALPVRVRVDVDTWISRTDLGPSHRTFVVAGDYVPQDLVGLPRSPA